jgi:hypothetical protein
LSVGKNSTKTSANPAIRLVGELVCIARLRNLSGYVAQAPPIPALHHRSGCLSNRGPAFRTISVPSFVPSGLRESAKVASEPSRHRCRFTRSTPSPAASLASNGSGIQLSSTVV